MNTDYKTMIIFLPTLSKKISYSEVRNLVRHLIGSVYENQDTKKDIDNADSSTPINCMAYDRQLGSEEKEAIDSMCTDNGIIALFIEGTELAFDEVNIRTIIISKED